MLISEMIGTCYNDAGRRLNEDSMTLQVYRQGDTSIVLGCVADGVGGNGNGDLASNYIIEQIEDWFCSKKEELCSANTQEITMAVYDQVMFIHNSFVKINALRGTKACSTLTVLMIIKGRYVILHVGDSRAYLYDQGKVTQITKDQTQGQRERDLGIEPERIAAAKESLLLQAMGLGTIRPQVYEGRLPEEYQILLCSDGLSNRLKPADIAEALNKRKTCKEKLMDLTQKSRQRGEKDNISAVLIVRRRKEAENAESRRCSEGEV